MRACPFCAEQIQDEAVVCRYCRANLATPQMSPQQGAAAQPAVSSASTVTCEKCKTGTMWSTRVPKFSEGLRLIGFTVWIPSLLLLAGATIVYLLALVGAGTATTAVAVEDIKPTLYERLEAVPGLSRAFLDASKDGKIELADWNMVSDDAKPMTIEIVTRYDAEVSMKTGGAAAGAIGTVAAAGVGGCGLMFAYFILVPAFIIGLVLTMKRNVWKCTNCGFIYDRA